MRTFRINIVFGKEDYDYFQTQTDFELTFDFWRDAIWDDYTEMELHDVERNKLLQHGDTTHDNIYISINNFLEGVSYILSENDYYCVEYGFKTPEGETIVSSKIFKEGDLYNEYL